MSESAVISRIGPFWDFLAGRRPAPGAARTLAGTVLGGARTRRDRGVLAGTEDFVNPTGNVQGGFLAAMVDDAPRSRLRRDPE